MAARGRRAPALSLPQPQPQPHPPPQGIAVHPDVAAALRAGRPVVALESTIIAHGMPHPHNVRAALAVEAAVRAGGATPATVAILAGVPTVGLTRLQIEALGAPGAGAVKVSRRDVAPCVAARGTGATTVAATALLAARAGISVFVTGGIGGVHRGGERSLDISADLPELARTPVAVVCAGAKSVLDIPRTLEVLETAGVPVVAWRQSGVPAFFEADSGVPAPARADTAAEAAAIIAAHLTLGLGGLVLAVPPPAEAAAGAAAAVAATEAALATAAAAGATGAAATPAVLAALHAATGGASLEANIALVRHNAEVGTAVAVALAQLAGRGGGGV